MVRALYLQWPGQGAAYEHPSEYTLGRDVLVAPVAKPGELASTEVWFPPGTWIDWFTGEHHEGPTTERLDVPLSRMPVFIRAGGIVPMQPNLPSTPEGPARALVLFAQSGTGATRLYDDSGRGFSYEHGKSTLTTISQRRSAGVSDFLIGAARGGFSSAPHTRSYEIRLAGIPRPAAVTIGGRRVGPWRYEAATRTAIVSTGARPTSKGLHIQIGGPTRMGGKR